MVIVILFQEWAIAFIENIFSKSPGQKESLKGYSGFVNVTDHVPGAVTLESYDIEHVIKVLTTQILSQGFKVIQINCLKYQNFIRSIFEQLMQ